MQYDRTSPECAICNIMQHTKFQETSGPLFYELQSLIADIPRMYHTQEYSLNTVNKICNTINTLSQTDKTFGSFFPNICITRQDVYRHALEHQNGLLGDIWMDVVELTNLKKTIPVQTTVENQDGDEELTTEDGISTEALQQHKLIEDNRIKKLTMIRSFYNPK